MKTSKKIIVGISVLILLLSIILNIVLLCTDVFRGRYTCSDEKYRYEITFYDNTFAKETRVKKSFSQFDGLFNVTYKAGQLVGYDYGFYQYIKSSEYKDAEYNTIILDSSRYSSSTLYRYTRNSVFSFTYETKNNKETYTCGVAVFLQVLYALLIVCCIITIILVTKKNKATEKDGE